MADKHFLRHPSGVGFIQATEARFNLTTRHERVNELRQLGDVSLATYLHETGLDLDDVYRNNRTWTELRRAAGVLPPALSDREAAVGRGVARLLHIDDDTRLTTYRRLLDRPAASVASALTDSNRRSLEGLLLTVLSPRKGAYSSLDDAAAEFWRHGELREELLDVLTLLEEQVVHLTTPLDLPSPVPLQVHASYTREEVLAAFGASTVSAPLPLQTGVYWHAATQTDLLFVTLQKTERDYSPTTRYLDYAISDTLFHWESQGTTSVASNTGQRYLNHRTLGTNVGLFVRQAKTDSTGRTMPYFCAGLADYVEHRSERPIQITWRLRQPLPGDTFAEYRAAIA